MPVVLVTHDVNEAQLLADRMVVIEKGRMLAAGSTGAVMSDPAALRGMGIRELAAMLPATIAGQEPDGMTRLDCAAGPLWLPRIEAEAGAQVRVRIMAHEVILSRARPEGLSAQNILPGTVARIVPGEGPAVIVHVAIGRDEVLARITRRAAGSLALQPGDAGARHPQVDVRRPRSCGGGGDGDTNRRTGRRSEPPALSFGVDAVSGVPKSHP